MSDTFEHKGKTYTYRPFDASRYTPIDDTCEPDTTGSAEAAERDLRRRYRHYDDIPQ